jgi:hypothetical protein
MGGGDGTTSIGAAMRSAGAVYVSSSGTMPL